MRSTYLAPTCKPWLRFHRDTWRVNESPREAREHFASRLKGWVRFRPRMFVFVFFCFSKKEEEAIGPLPVRRASRLKARVRFRPRMFLFFFFFAGDPMASTYLARTCKPPTTICFFVLFFKIRVYKRNNEQLIDASFFVLIL